MARWEQTGSGGGEVAVERGKVAGGAECGKVAASKGSKQSPVIGLF